MTTARRGLRTLVFVTFAALCAIPAACGASSEGAGANGSACSLDRDCAANLKCLRRPESFTPAAGCAFANTECLLPCQSDSDCAALGGNLRCFVSCGGVCE